MSDEKTDEVQITYLELVIAKSMIPKSIWKKSKRRLMTYTVQRAFGKSINKRPLK